MFDGPKWPYIVLGCVLTDKMTVFDGPKVTVCRVLECVFTDKMTVFDDPKVTVCRVLECVLTDKWLCLTIPRWLYAEF